MIQIVAFVLMALLMTSVVAVYAQAAPSKEEYVDTNYGGPVIHDTFWTNRTTLPSDVTGLEKVEVSPGDGTSILAVVFINRGFSEITSITGTLETPSGFRASTGSMEAVAKHSGIVKPGAAFTLFFEINVLESARVQDYTAPLTVQYNKVLEVGSYRTADLLAQFRVTGKTILDAEATNELAPGSANEVPISISNKGTAAATGAMVTVSTDAGNSSTGAVVIGQRIFDLGTIPVNGSVDIRPTIYVGATDQTQQLVNLLVSYNNVYGVRSSTTIPVGLIVLPRALEVDIDVTPGEASSSIVTAGKIHDYSFVVSNISGSPLSNVFITLATSSDSIRILGDSEWTVAKMDPEYKGEFTTQVFAPTSMIGESTTFNLSLQYLSTGHTKTDSIELGAYIDGEINIRAYDIAVSYIGGTPNIVGSLLNEGNTVALFTTIDIMGAEKLVSNLPPQQYIGDLEENSPLPFSIPINVDSRVGAGTYPVSLKVTYKDDLRKTHTIYIDSEVQFAPEQVADQSTQNSMLSASMPIGIGVAAAAVIAAVAFRRRKKTTLKRTFQASKEKNDIEFVLDSQSNKDDHR
jgi:hypothetical protein